ncbi:hypothetical protein BTO15_07580 [Polaribacter sejongensis]|uniref:DUF3853 family protein n=2 Tax=Flavobacteriaceae TaxID=49546 RepID=A0AAJ1QUM6_9FLAO|nr:MULTISPECIES: DUF3853 family protein [Polaribacter]AUC21969.1 hypothetical protein BTO15_07580 [Polaribacter sejongensis]MDN3618619.1 DUF3853 family protein [Polaribacter undariae]UWD30400.1 DUF3853 family protein [Polaribacter undariae]
MNLEILRVKLLIQMTGEEFIFLQNNLNNEVPLKNVQPEKKEKHVFGILGIAKLFGCSKSSANRIKKSGIIDEAIIQNGRKIIVDTELALELMKESK